MPALNNPRRRAALARPGIPEGDSPGGGGGPPPGTPSADQMYQSARSQHLRGASGTARMGYQDFLKAYPGDPRAPDALFYVGDTFGDQVPDSAVAYYNQVVSRFPQASRASTALLRLGRIAESRRNPGAARTYYERIIREYPRSDDVDLAQERLKILRP